MKNDKKVFILIEVVLAVVVLVMALVMLLEKTDKDYDKVSVIIQNSDDNQWSAFIYGLKMAAEDNGIDIFVVSTGAVLTVEEEESLIENEISNGADAVIVQPVSGDGMEKMLKRIHNKVPLMLVEDRLSKDQDASAFAITEPDNYAMGKALAEEVRRDYNENLDGKMIGILSETKDSKAVMNREKGFKDGLKDTGAEVSWSVSRSFAADGELALEFRPKVDLLIALDDNSLTTAGKESAANNLHGAIVYGIGKSTEAVYYLDTGAAECLVVPDEFNVGYQSLTEIAKSLKNRFRKTQNKKVSYTVIHREELFSKENQEILFTMSQ